MWWALAVLSVFILPLMAFRAYSAALCAWAMRRAPAAAKPALAARMRMNVANVIQKVGIVLVLVSTAARDDRGLGLLGWISVSIIFATIVWTFVEMLVGRGAARRMDAESRAYLDGLNTVPAFPWRKASRLGAD